MSENTDLTYYQRNQDGMLNKAKDYYKNNKERLTEQARDKYKTYLKEKKIKENMGKIDTTICLKKKKQRQKEY